MPSPGYIQFVVPPLSVDLPEVLLEDCKFVVRAKFYDYGIISIRLSLNFSGTWNEFARLACHLKQSEELAQRSTETLGQLLNLAGLALRIPHAPLVEDYFVLEVRAFQSKLTSSELLERHRSSLAALLLGEPEPLAISEEQDAVRFAFSYSQSDLTVVHWDAAFVFDNREGAEAVNSILEFANTQLVELRTYDARLDDELSKIYKWKLARLHTRAFWGRRTLDDQTVQLRRLLVDVRELCDRANNALKFIGDAFYARLYRGVSVRLGLPDWQQQVESKLSSVGEIYRFTTDQAQNARGEFLEIIIIVLIVVEILFGALEAWH